MTPVHDIRHWPTLAEFEAHLAQYDPAICRWVKGLCIHHTYIPTVAQWRGRASMDGMLEFYAGKGWDGAPHIYVAPDGLYQMNPLNLPGIHAGPCNKDHWGMEVVGDYDKAFWQEPIRSLAYGAICALLRWRGLAADTVKGHRECMPHQKTCPGSAIDLDRLRADVAQRLSVLAAPTPVPVPIPNIPELTADATLLSPPRASAAQAIAYIVARGSVYTPEDITTIVGYYWRYGVECGIDPLLAVAQCIHETSAQQDDGRWFAIASWWARRPNRNPAGLGVTGVIQHDRPPDVVGWTQDEQGRWHQGLHFATWEWSVIAHLGRLLAYALKEGTETSTQRRLVVYALNLRRLPDEYRGAAPTLAGLAGRWAVPGRRYDQRIASIANEIMRLPR
jgi:hypothetical protein